MVLSVVIPAVVWAANRDDSGAGSFQAERQAFQWRRDTVGLTSRDWQDLPLRGTGDGQVQPGNFPLTFVAGSPISAAVSLGVKGAPIELRVVDTGRVMAPGRVSFDGRRASNAFSFTFVSPSTNEVTCRNVKVQWRSPTGERAVFLKGDLVVTYKPGDLAGGAACA